MAIFSPAWSWAAEDMVKQVRMNGLRYMTGSTISPLTAFLVLRGLKTLELRVDQHCEVGGGNRGFSCRAGGCLEHLLSRPCLAIPARRSTASR